MLTIAIITIAIFAAAIVVAFGQPEQFDWIEH